MGTDRNPDVLGALGDAFRTQSAAPRPWDVPLDEELLAAYLEGRLDEMSLSAVESLIAQSATVRAQAADGITAREATGGVVVQFPDVWCKQEQTELPIWRSRALYAARYAARPAADLAAAGAPRQPFAVVLGNTPDGLTAALVEQCGRLQLRLRTDSRTNLGRTVVVVARGVSSLVVRLQVVDLGFGSYGVDHDYGAVTEVASRLGGRVRWSFCDADQGDA